MFGTDLPAQDYNNLVIESLTTADGIEKFAAGGQSFIRQKIREAGFARRIMPPISVTRADLQRATDHDTLVKIVDLEPDSAAMALNFVGESNDHYIQGRRYAIPFFKIESEKFIKSEAELMAYDYPITKVIEENSVKDIQKVEDTVFVNHADSAIALTGNLLVSPVTSIDRRSVANLFKVVDFQQQGVGVLLMTNVDFDDWMVQPATDIGSPLASELTVEGYKYQTIMNKKVIVTNKFDIIAPGEIYAFPEPAYLGNFYILNDVKFWIKKEADLVMWKTWEYIGMGFGGIRGIAKLELNVPSPQPVNGTI